jgi:hypothetical protein
MVESIDKAFKWLIVHAPSWEWTSRLMRWRYFWFSRYRVWDEDEHMWIKAKRGSHASIESGDGDREGE